MSFLRMIHHYGRNLHLKTLRYGLILQYGLILEPDELEPESEAGELPPELEPESELGLDKVLLFVKLIEELFPSFVALSESVFMFVA